jgi:hypothetical protein
MAALWPERCEGIVAVSGYLIANREANRQPLTPQAEYAWWYQYYFATERGERGYSEHRRDFGKLIWRLASPKWQFDETAFERTARSFDKGSAMRTVKAAAVQISPVLYSREGTVDQVVRKIRPGASGELDEW